MAALIHRPLIPWQRELVDTAGELTVDGRFVYRYVVVIVPRRAGKTLAMLAYALALTRARRRCHAFYANHRRETASVLWRDDWWPTLEDSPLTPDYVHIRQSNGSEAIEWRTNGSTIRLAPPNGNAMRTLATDLIVLDEAREFSVEQGDAFEAATFPTQATGRGGQAWIVSNAGTAESAWLARWRDRGRLAAADPGSPLCYLEYAAPPDADPDDPATLAAAHPGIGHHVLEDVIWADRAVMGADTWSCEYLGWWPESLTDTRLLDAWDAAEVPGELELGTTITLALELDELRETACVVAAGTGPDGSLALELVEHRPHGAWVVPRLASIIDAWGPIALTYDAGGPAAALAHELGDLATTVIPLNVRETAAAAGSLYDHVLAGNVAHNGDEVLAASIRAARRRRVGGGWVFDRRQPGAGPLIAAALAAWVYHDGTARPPTIT